MTIYTFIRDSAINAGDVTRLDVRTPGSPTWVTASTYTNVTADTSPNQRIASAANLVAGRAAWLQAYEMDVVTGYNTWAYYPPRDGSGIVVAGIKTGDPGVTGYHKGGALTYCGSFDPPPIELEVRLCNTTTGLCFGLTTYGANYCDPCDLLRKAIDADYATTTNLTGTYAPTYDADQLPTAATTLTATVNGALVVDGVTVSNGDIILLKDQTNNYENGAWTVSDAGSVSTPWILNTQRIYGAGAWVLVLAGTVNTDTKYWQSSYQTITIQRAIQIFTETDCLEPLNAGTPGPAGPTGSTGPTGPAGPTGPTGPTGCGLSYAGGWVTSTAYKFESGSPCKTEFVLHNGVNYICKLAHTSSAADEPGIGASWATYWDVFAGGTAGAMVWQGDWAIGPSYQENDVVRYDGDAYVCFATHTGAADKLPSQSDFTYWNPATDVGAAISPENVSFLEDLANSVFDWLDTAISNGDWLSLLGAGIGLAVAGTVVNEMLSFDETGDGNADSRYDGTAGYNGAFTPPTLPTVITSLMLYAGKSGADFDVSLLPATPCQFTIANTLTLGTLLQQMSQAFQFDIVPSGGVVKFVPKTLAVARVLTAADLGHAALSGDELAGSAPYTAKRLQGIDLPRSVTLNYYSSDLDYNIFSQVALMETYTEGQDVRLDVPFLMSNAEARRIAESGLINSHVERQEFTFTTDAHNIDLEPGDIVTIPLDTGSTADVRIIQITSQDDGILEITAVRADLNTTLYTVSTIPATTTPTQDTNVPVAIGYSNAVFFEVPPLNDTDTTGRFYCAPYGAATGWPGATVYRSIDGGVTYNSLTTAYLYPTIGKVSAATAAPTDYHVWDDTTTITVVLRQGTLSNAASDLAVQNGDNWCKVGDEVIGFRYASLIAPLTYQLTRLLRGRAGTEPNVASHLTNELFVVLDNTITRLDVSLADINKPVKYKIVTVGSDISKATAIDVSPYGLNLRPWRVAQPTAVRNLPAVNDWKVNWIERPRFYNGLRDYTEIVHDADWAGFAVAIMDPGGTVLRTATTVSPEFVYTAAMQVTDFGSVQTTIKISIVQLSTIVGGGYPSLLNA